MSQTILRVPVSANKNFTFWFLNPTRKDDKDIGVKVGHNEKGDNMPASNIQQGLSLK